MDLATPSDTIAPTADVEKEEARITSQPHIRAQPCGESPTSLRARMSARGLLSLGNPLIVALTLLALLVARANAALIEFQNCVNNSYSLQFTPILVDATFDTDNPSHLINITVYGNVSGNLFAQPLPEYTSPLWNDPSYTFGKIVNTSNITNGDTQVQTQSSLETSIKVLTYDPVSVPDVGFCSATRGGTQCPVAPVFNGSDSDPSTLRAFGFEMDLNSSYRFVTIDTTFTINDAQLVHGSAPVIGCISANVTPDLGSSLRGLLRFLPLAILVLVAAATVSAAILSPWGSSNPFKWTSNYGRDEDLLRLVTPGFGDCLQYIQFVFLSGALSLSYPGYFRPVVSTVNWSALMFNESFVSHGPPVQNPRDGVYATHPEHIDFPWAVVKQNSNHDYGMTRLRQLTGISSDEDIWAGTVIWLLVIIAAVLVVCQFFFLTRWALRAIAHQTEEDLRSKNWPFTAGMLVRLVCNFFLLPLVTVSLFQLVVAGDSQVVVVVFAIVLILALLAFGGWIFRIIFVSKPRSLLFDDLPTVLLYGPLYNTFSDEAALFGLIPVLITFMRGVAIGAIQPSGIAQIVVLAICEVVLILTLQSFRPFRKQTSMNAYHTFFSATRLVVVLLSISFLPTLGVTEPTKGWIGYAILLLHAIVLVFGFLLNALQTLIEVVARYAGAGADETTGAATRGTFVKVFGKRQLTRRRRRPGFRHSLNSDAAMLTDDADALENKSAAYGSRSRSLSASSAILLNQRTPDRLSSHLDRVETGSGTRDFSAANSIYTALQDPESGVGPSTRPDLSLRTDQPAAPFYRAPRQRRPTGEMMPPGQRSRASWAGADMASGAGQVSPEGDKRESIGKAISTSPEGRSAPGLAYMRRREGSDPTILNDPRRPDVDYAVREVDFYYNVRGPRLNDQPTRQLKTGPADPVGPVSSATGWFKTMFGRKSKDAGKGFEVVRSAKAPPEPFVEEDSPELEPYQDSPAIGTAVAEPTVLPGQRTRSNEEDREQARGGAEEPVSPVGSSDGADAYDARISGVSDLAPSLGPIDAGSSIHMPSRFNSRNTQVPSRFNSTATGAGRDAQQAGGQQPPLLGDLDVGGSIHVPSRFNSTATAASGAERPATPPGRVPFSTPLSPIHASRASMGAESALSVEREGSLHGAPHALGVPGHDDRPSSMGYVQHYRTADRITQGTPDLELSQGHEAELVDGASSKRSARSSRGYDRAL